MRKRKKAADAKIDLFKRLCGVKPVTFDKMLSILQKEYDTLHQKGGKPPKLTVKDKLSITLKYLREYRTMDSIAAEYGVCKGTLPVHPMGGRHTDRRRYIRSARKKGA